MLSIPYKHYPLLHTADLSISFSFYHSIVHEKIHLFSNIVANILGNNILYIGFYGPKGPCEEVQVKHMGRNIYQVNYSVRERGEYILIIKWGEEHIPGSPYRVEV